MAAPANLCTDPTALAEARRRSLGLIASNDADLRAIISEHARCVILHPTFDDGFRDFLVAESSQRYSLNADEAAFFATTVIEELSTEVARLRASLCSGGVA